MLDSAKEGARGSAEGSDIGLGEHFQAFESHTPDQTQPSRAKKRYKADETDVFLSSWFRQYLQSLTRKYFKHGHTVYLLISKHFDCFATFCSESFIGHIIRYNYIAENR